MTVCRLITHHNTQTHGEYGETYILIILYYSACRVDIELYYAVGFHVYFMLNST